MTINRIRYLHFMAGVLVSQQEDPLCGKCKAFANTVAWTREALDVCRSDASPGIPPDIPTLFADAQRRLDAIRVPDDAVGQKKAGNCMLPEGVCFVKNSKKLGEAL